jgi:hypothetical protein
MSNLSMGLIEHGLGVLQRQAYPVYQQNLARRNRPFPQVAQGEYLPSAIAILLMMTGLDQHLARLKYLRDEYDHNPPLPHTPYFNWQIPDSLFAKLEKLLIRRSEKRLKQQLIEMTVMRDVVVHPKLYVIEKTMDSDLNFVKATVRLSAGDHLREKTLKAKFKRSERTRYLRLPLVAIWASYPDVVVCALVLNRFLNLLEEKYENPYAWVGGVSVKNEPVGFFKNWKGNIRRRTISMEEWMQSFYESLSSDDRQEVNRRLGADASKYIRKPQPRIRFKYGTVRKILHVMQHPPKPEFLRKPPP